MTTHFLGQLAALIITYISGRSSNQSGSGEALGIFAHVYAYERVGRTKQVLSYLLGQMGLADTGWTEEHKDANRLVGRLQPHPIAHDGFGNLFHSFILRYYGLLECGSQRLQLCGLAFRDAPNGHTGHRGNNLCNVCFAYPFPLFAFFRHPLAAHIRQFLFQDQFPVTIAYCQLKVLLLGSTLLLFLNLGQLLLSLSDFGRDGGMRQMHMGAGLVQNIDCLVGETTVTYISIGKTDTRFECLVGIFDMVMLLVARLDILQDTQGVFCRSRLNQNLLEPALQGSVLLYRVAIFVKCGSADTLYGAARQSRLHDVGCIHAARCAARANHRVYLVDEDDYVWIVLQFLQQCADAFFKLTSVFGSGYDCSQVKINQTLVEQQRRSLLLDYHLCQAFYNGTFTHAWLTDEYGIVLFTPTEDFGDAQNLLIAPYHGVKFALGCSAGQVYREVVYDGSASHSVLSLGGSSRVTVRTIVIFRSFSLIVIRHEKSVYRTTIGFLSQIVLHIFVFNIVVIENFLSSSVSLIMQDSKQHMVDIHHLAMLQTGFQDSQPQYITGLLGERYLAV